MSGNFRRKTITVEAATERLETLCARSEQCSYELTVKMKRWGLSGAQIEAVIEGLTQRGYLDDQRFANAFVSDKYRFSSWGRRKIMAALAAKRIPSAMVREALGEIDPDIYTGRLDNALRVKNRSLPDDMEPLMKRRKLYQFALARGYESAEVSKAIRRLTDSPTEEWAD